MKIDASHLIARYAAPQRPVAGTPVRPPETAAVTREETSFINQLLQASGNQLPQAMAEAGKGQTIDLRA